MDADLDTPVVDNHLHLDPDSGQGLAAVEEFARAEGTHLLVVNKPSWQLGVEVAEGEDFRAGFERTVEVVEAASERLAGRAWPVLGVHPALVSRLVDDRGMAVADARDLMMDGLAVAAAYAADGPAVALKSGRPHYPVEDAVWEASNAVTRRAFALAADAGVAVQLHTEDGEAFPEFAEWAADAGLDPDRVVKHYARGRCTGAVPSVTSRRDRLETAAEADEPFLMETDFLDDPDRPGAVLGPRTVPRRTRWLLEEGHDAAVRTAHVDAPMAVYGVDTRGTLG